MLNRIPFSSKLVLIGLFVVLSLGASLYGLHLNFEQINQRAHAELEGLALIKPLTEAVQLLQQHRGASAGVLGGSPDFAPIRAVKEREIEAALSDFERRLASQDELQEAWRSIVIAWQRIRADGLRWSSHDNFVAHTQMIEGMRHLQSLLADEYGLTIDANLDSFYLNHTARNELLDTMERLGQLRAHGIRVLARRKASPQEIEIIKIDIALLHHQLAQLKAGLKKVERYNPGLQTAVSASYNSIEASASQAIQEVQSGILAGDFGGQAADYMTVMTTVINHGYSELYDVLMPSAQTLIRERRDQAISLQQSSTSIAILLLLVTIYFLAAFYYATRRGILSLSGTVSGFARGDMRDRIALPAHDELFDIGQSFNRMADDIVDLMQAQQDASARIHAIFDSSHDAVVQMNADGCISGWSKQAQAMFGWASDEVVGRPLHEAIIPARHRAAHVHGLKRFLDCGEGPLLDSRVETQALHRLGHEFPVELALTCFQAKGRFEFNAFIHDISARKEAEGKLRLAACVFANAREGIAIADAHGVFVDVNPTFCEITGYSRDEAVGQHTRLLSSGRHDAEFYAAMWTSITQAGAWSGEIWNRRKNGAIYPERLTISTVKDKDGTVTNYIANFTDVTAYKAAEEEIRNLAFYDALTHLPNRRLLQDRLCQALASRARSDRHGAILFIDLDNFKALNDCLGHDMGDLLLQQVAQRLVSCVRQGDTVARLGGDEFVVMLDELNANALEARAQTQVVANKILDTLARPYHLRAHACHSTPSIGATLFCGQYATPAQLLKQADTAMYESKKAGRNTVRFFRPEN